MSEEEKSKIVTRKEVVVSLPVIKAPRWIQGFINFIREQGVVGVAVGLIFGLASKGLVDSIVNNVINPIVGVVLGSNNLSSKFMCVKSLNGVCTSKIGYGQVLSDLISFLIILAVVYFIIKGLKLDRLDKKKEAAK